MDVGILYVVWIEAQGSMTFACQVCPLALCALTKLTAIFIGLQVIVQLYYGSSTLFFYHLSSGFFTRVTLFSQLAGILGTIQIRQAVIL
ncbi:hypothetical protein BDR07DRAFT_1099300 [Suillus spraguei]|nr:hypothetical protein BDR07DRAFT_1099300 [Suillus spraguei]